MNTTLDRGPTLIEYKGKQVWFSDWTGLEGTDFLGHVLGARAKFKTQIENGARDMLMLIDATNALTDTTALKELTENARMVSPHVKGSAVVGLDAMKKNILRFINAMGSVKARPFNTKEEALDWLVDL